MWAFPKIVVEWMVKIMKPLLKIGDLGVPLFLETPMWFPIDRWSFSGSSWFSQLGFFPLKIIHVVSQKKPRWWQLKDFSGKKDYFREGMLGSVRHIITTI